DGGKVLRRGRGFRFRSLRRPSQPLLATGALDPTLWTGVHSLEQLPALRTPYDDAHGASP
ncbi:MAG: hypothetical protein NTY65_00775, partial [Planctomycetota bacterium]|nr:hypothetical protein [Planctomycetota bacterium]